MRLELGLNLRLKQEMRLAPQIIQSIEILQLPALDLRELIENELQENEALEVLEPAPDGVAELLDRPDVPPSDDNEHDDGLVHDAENVLERLDDLTGGRGDGVGRLSRGAAEEASDRKLEAMQNAADTGAGLADHLQRQLDEMELDAAVRLAALAIIYNLDDAGRLACSLEDVAAGMDVPASHDVLERALAVVQRLEPKGVGARSLAECLLLQLDPQDPHFEMKRTLLRDHFDDLVRNKRPRIARALGMDMAELNELIQGLSHLTARPGASYDTSPVPYIRPDVVIEWQDGEYVVRLINDQLPRVGLSREVRRMLKEARGDPRLREHLKRKIESAKWLIEAIAQRQSTLDRVANEIVGRQQDFLEYGVRHLRPLKMQEVADALGIHVSTVSRAISDKHAQTPRGIVPLKSFFTGGTENEDGGVESRLSVKERVRQIIEDEDKSDPLSDDAVAEALKERCGLEIARRTVTKYRKALGIPSSRQRRVWT
jgi:RNA polymerase sigma-54 factor